MENSVVKTSQKKKLQKADDFRIFPYRRIIQFGFLAIILWIGVEFVIFINQLESGLLPTISRPPGVEVFLPISALIGLKYWLLSGIFNLIHPSGLVLLLVILATGLFLKKGFCSWVCPLGLLSEYLAAIHIKIFDRIRTIPGWLDYPLRSLKYLLLLFFAWAIFVGMDVVHLEKFIYSPYNRVADIKMLKFFADLSATTFWTLIILTLLSVLIPYFWCRYLCPYGALLGFISFFSPLKIHRNDLTCINCDKCTKVCPARIKVDKASTVFSDECHACLMCVDSCPVNDTLFLSVTGKNLKLSRSAYAIIIVIVFLFGVSVAKITGYWENEISSREYLFHIRRIEQPNYLHNRGSVPEYEKEIFQLKKESDINPEDPYGEKNE